MLLSSQRGTHYFELLGSIYADLTHQQALVTESEAKIMGRHRGFDQRAVVTAARQLFWERGYEGASLPELEAVTGLNRSSLYNTFGSKRGLFDAAVESYLVEVVRPRLAVLMQDPVPPGAVTTYVQNLRTALLDAQSMSARNGCLLINTAGSTLGHDKVTQATVDAYRQELLTGVTRGVAAHRPDLTQGEVERRAQACVGQIVAALALARINAEAAGRSLDTALELLNT